MTKPITAQEMIKQLSLKGITQKDIAKSIGMAQGSIAHHLKNEMTMGKVHFDKLRRFYRKNCLE